MTSTELWYKTTTNWGGKNLHRHKNILCKRKKTQHQQNDVEASSNKWKSCHFLQKKEKPRLFGCVAYHYCWNCCSSHPRQVVLSELTTSQKYYPVSPRAGLRSTALVVHSSFSQCWFGKRDTRWIKSLYLASLEIIWEDNNWCSCKKQWEMCEHSQTGNQK